jgi:hypothetical protein
MATVHVPAAYDREAWRSTVEAVTSISDAVDDLHTEVCRPVEAYV